MKPKASTIGDHGKLVMDLYQAGEKQADILRHLEKLGVKTSRQNLSVWISRRMARIQERAAAAAAIGLNPTVANQLEVKDRQEPAAQNPASVSSTVKQATSAPHRMFGAPRETPATTKIDNIIAGLDKPAKSLFKTK